MNLHNVILVMTISIILSFVLGYLVAPSAPLHESPAISPAETGIQKTESLEAATISVAGVGVAYASPDRVEIIIAIMTERPLLNAVDAYTLVAERCASVVESLRQVEEIEEIATLDVWLRPQYRWERSGERVFEGYMAGCRLRVLVPPEKAGSVIAKAITAGANVIESLTLTFSQESLKELKLRAIEAAVEDAKTKAELLASKLGISIVGIKSASLTEYSPPSLPVKYFTDFRTLEGLPELPVEKGTMAAAKATVLVTFLVES